MNNYRRYNGENYDSGSERRYESEAQSRREEPSRRSSVRNWLGGAEKQQPVASPTMAESSLDNGNNIVMYSPTTYDDVQKLIDFLKHRQQVIVDFSRIAPESVQRILDFMSGAVYALSGSTQRITKCIYLFAPQGVSIVVPPNIKR